MISFDYAETSKWIQGLEGIQQELHNWLFQYMYRKMNQFLERVKARTPVRTGLLVESWKIQRIEWEGATLSAYYINDAHDGWANYATFVEYGHAKPYKAGAKPGSSDWVQGFFMLTFTEKEIEKEIPTELKTGLKHLFQKHLG